MSVTVGIDIGGSSVKAVTRDDSGEILQRYESPIKGRGGPHLASAALTAWRSFDGADRIALGIGVPGQVDPITGQVSHAVNLGIDTPYGLGAEVSKEVGVPVIIENDVRAAALGAYESLARFGDSPESLALVSIGTGISAGVIVKGSLVRGAHGLAGEVGHVVVDESGPVCRCGQRGCLEAVAAGPAIGKAWPKGEASAAATALFTSAVGGDPAAQRVASRIAGHITTALIWLAAAYDSEVVVLGGGVSLAGADFLTIIRNQIVSSAAASELAARRLRPDQVVLADPADPPGPRGAALIAASHSLQERVSPASKQASNNQ